MQVSVPATIHIINQLDSTLLQDGTENSLLSYFLKPMEVKPFPHLSMIFGQNVPSVEADLTNKLMFGLQHSPSTSCKKD